MSLSCPSLSSLLENRQGVMLADEHNNSALHDFVASQMGDLAKAGVKVLFLEMFNDTPEQRAWLTEFNKSDSGKASPEMQQWLKSKWAHPPATGESYLQLVEEAHKNHIEVIGIEPASRDPFFPIRSSNAAWAKTVTEHLAGKEGVKYAVLGGRLHTHLANQATHEPYADQTTGIDKLLHIPCVTFVSSLPAHGIPAGKINAGEDAENYYAAIPKPRQHNPRVNIAGETSLSR